jgi:hypothetical protein
MRQSRWEVLGTSTCVAMLIGATVAHAQIDLSGSWTNWNDQDNRIRAPGPDPDTFLAVPMNAAARAAAVAYSPEDLAQLDVQCAAWPLHYIVVGGFPEKIWATKRIDGSVLAWNIGGTGDRYATTIWMDGRPAPSPQAPHTLGGYTTGRWLGDTLVTTTTHMQDGLLTRNGAPSSDQEVFTLFLTRHDNFLNVTGIVHDPVYLTEPYILSDVLTYNGSDNVASIPDPMSDPACTPEEEDASTNNYRVPSFITPAADTLNYAPRNYGIPLDTALGNAASMYPDYIATVQKEYRQPKGYCTLDCCGNQGADPYDLNGGMAFNVNVLKCKQDNP